MDVYLSFSILNTSVSFSCPPGWFDCGGGQCISRLWHCDGTPDCRNHKDEVECGQDEYRYSLLARKCEDRYFYCYTSDVCLPYKWVCDGHLDCPNLEDELNCSRPAACLGGFICNCNSCIPKEWYCDGVSDCSDASDEVNCTSNGSPTACTRVNNQFHCESGECISLSHVCNGHKDCRSGEDENINCWSTNCSRTNCSHGCHVMPGREEHCVCRRGYTLSSDGTSCKDINECAIPGWCSHHCINRLGSFDCLCHPDYVLQLDNRTCLAHPNNLLLLGQLEWRKFISWFFFGLVFICFSIAFFSFCTVGMMLIKRVFQKKDDTVSIANDLNNSN